MDKHLLGIVLRTMDEKEARYKPYIRKRARLFAESVVDDPAIAPKTGEDVEDAELLLAAIRGFLLGYGFVVDGVYCKDAEAIQPAALASPQWEALVADVPEATPAMLSRASLFLEGAMDADVQFPRQYYATFGFLKGMVAGEEDLESGAADYFSEKKPEDDLMLEVIGYGSARRRFAQYAEDVFLACGGEAAEGDAEAKGTEILVNAAALTGLPVGDGDAEESWLLEVISQDVGDFVKYTCGGRSGRHDRPAAEEYRWADVYAGHYIFGFFGYLLDALDEDEILEEESYPQFDGGGYGAPADDLRISMLERGNRELEDIELAIRHMKATWDVEKEHQGIGPENTYWQVCGLAYAEGVRKARECQRGNRNSSGKAATS